VTVATRHTVPAGAPPAPGLATVRPVLPLRDDNPVRHPPVVTWLIIGACLLAYFVWQPSPFSDDTDDLEFSLRHAAIPCEITQARPLSDDEVIATFRFGDDEACGAGAATSPEFDPGKNVWLAVVVSLFLHASLLHIGGNLLFLWVFGNNVEDTLGKIGFAAFYLAGGIVAAGAHVLVNPDSTVPVVGASGAIAAVMGAYLVLFPNVRVRTLFFITLVDIPAKWVLGFWFVLQFFTDPNSGVAWVAHVGGFAFGVLVGLMARRFGAGRPRDAVRPSGWRPPPPTPPGPFGGRY
jgi:membrane associated rhomboid family serine protease